MGEVRKMGKVTGTDRLEKSTCSPRAHPPFRPKLYGEIVAVTIAAAAAAEAQCLY